MAHILRGHCQEHVEEEEDEVELLLLGAGW